MYKIILSSVKLVFAFRVIVMKNDLNIKKKFELQKGVIFLLDLLHPRCLNNKRQCYIHYTNKNLSIICRYHSFSVSVCRKTDADGTQFSF